jgi:hypothetical protein
VNCSISNLSSSWSSQFVFWQCWAITWYETHQMHWDCWDQMYPRGRMDATSTMDAQMKGRTGRQTAVHTDGWSDGRTDRGTDRQTDRRTDSQADARTDRQTVGRTNGRMDGRTDSRSDGMSRGAGLCLNRSQLDSSDHHMPVYPSICQYDVQRIWYGMLASICSLVLAHVTYHALAPGLHMLAYSKMFHK